MVALTPLDIKIAVPMDLLMNTLSREPGRIVQMGKIDQVNEHRVRAVGTRQKSLEHVDDLKSVRPLLLLATRKGHVKY